MEESSIKNRGVCLVDLRIETPSKITFVPEGCYLVEGTRVELIVPNTEVTKCSTSKIMCLDSTMEE
jgi:hypothetical protein